MRRGIRTTIFLAGLSIIGLAPVNAATITVSTDATALANLLKGPGVTIVSATLTGGTNQAGTFTGGGTPAVGVGFDSGIVLSSGDVTNIPGTNVTLAPGENLYANNTGSNTLSTIVGSPGDTDLTIIAGAPTFDASILTITFSLAAPGDLFFNFVFGSEEYIDYIPPPGFVGFNDVFGFFVDGTNIALVGGQPITVKTINPVVNASSYRNNVDNVNGFPNLGLNLKFDGLTTVLQARQTGLSAGTHVLKLAVADALDQRLDAGVFIQAGSLASTSPLSFAKAFNPATVAANSNSVLTFTITNPNPNTLPNADLSAIAFTDTLPTGLVVAAVPGVVNNCGGTVTATAAATTISLTGGALPANAAGTAACTISVNVLANGAALGLLTNTTSSITSTPGGTGPTATGTINVGPAAAAPTFAKVFGAPSVLLNGNTSLSFTITNPNAFTLTGLGFADPLPAGLVVATPNSLMSTCGGTVSAVAGSSTITLVGGTVAGNTACTITLNVTGTAIGSRVNTTTSLTSTNAPVGSPAVQTVLVIGPIALTKTFVTPSIAINGVSALSFTLTNPNTTTAVTAIAFSDTLAAGLAVSNPNGLTGTCGGGTITAVAGSNSITLTGATLAASASCTFSVNVTGLGAGLVNNITSTVTSANAGIGAAAAAVINVVAPINYDSYFQVRYASNLNVGDSVFNITNNGASSTVGLPAQNGNLCVNVYAFSPDEQLISCCSCLVTPNGLVSLSARNDLIVNTLTPAVPTSIVLKLVSSAAPVAPATCNASTAGGNASPLALGMVAYGTTLHAAPVTPGTPATTYNVTETRFTPSTLSAAELVRLTQLCSFIQSNGSGFGICKSCRFGGLGAESK